MNTLNTSISIVNASQFNWRGNHGTATIKEIGFLPHQIIVRSDRTGEVKYFSLDTDDAMFEDHWDGELVKLVSADGNLRLTVWMEQPLF